MMGGGMTNVNYFSANPSEAGELLGIGSHSSSSVPMALWCFLSCQDDAVEAVVRAVNLGETATQSVR